MDTKVAVVTGSNKGVGFAIVRALCRQWDGDVYLTSRDESRGKAAIKQLEGEGLHPKFHQLDIDDHESVVRLRDFLRKTYCGLDILVNNAAILMDYDSIPFAEKAAGTTRTNFFSTLDVCKVLFPILRPHSRVVNLSSMFAQIGFAKCSEAVKAKFTDYNLTMDELIGLVNKFVETAKENKHLEAGFCSSSYIVSKIGVIAMTVIQQREIDSQGANDIVINACCPGYVDTDMSSHKGKLTIDEGAVTPVYCALLPLNVKEPRGQFISEKRVVDWKAGNSLLLPL